MSLLGYSCNIVQTGHSRATRLTAFASRCLGRYVKTRKTCLQTQQTELQKRNLNSIPFYLNCTFDRNLVTIKETSLGWLYSLRLVSNYKILTPMRDLPLTGHLGETRITHATKLLGSAWLKPKTIPLPLPGSVLRLFHCL